MNPASFKLLFLSCALVAGSTSVAQDSQKPSAGEAPRSEQVRSPSTDSSKPAPVRSDRIQPAAGALPVGVVDFAKILEAYPRAIDLRKQLDVLMEQRQAELDEFQKRISEISGLRDNFREGSNEWLNKDLEVQLAVRAIEGKRQIFQQELRSEREKFYVTMLEDMQRAVAMIAKDRKIGLVLRVHEDVLDGSIESKARIFESRVVWFASEEIDLTPAVIKLLQVPLPPESAGQSGKSGGDDKSKETNRE